jgi:hypothetical protein
VSPSSLELKSAIRSRLGVAVVLCFATCSPDSTFAQARIGISVGVNQPGVYGRVQIGDEPTPPVVMQQPIIISQQPVYVERRPIYLYVSPAEQRDWRRYCRRYEA